jgi:hypothetical protein
MPTFEIGKEQFILVHQLAAELERRITGASTSIGGAQS